MSREILKMRRDEPLKQGSIFIGILPGRPETFIGLSRAYDSGKLGIGVESIVSSSGRGLSDIIGNDAASDVAVYLRYVRRYLRTGAGHVRLESPR